MNYKVEIRKIFISTRFKKKKDSPLLNVSYSNPQLNMNCKPETDTHFYYVSN